MIHDILRILNFHCRTLIIKFNIDTHIVQCANQESEQKAYSPISKNMKVMRKYYYILYKSYANILHFPYYLDILY